MFSIEIDGIRVLYTGDYSMEEDRHLMCAEVPPGGPPDVLIVESTFGVVTLPARQEREARFTGENILILEEQGIADSTENPY
jgi:cleavage and polyadenylation specificity factor subunit 3